MNVLYHFRTRGTGAEAVHIAGVAKALERLGHSVSFCSPGNVDPRRSAGRSPFAVVAGSRWRILPRPVAALAFELLELGYNFAAFTRLRFWLHRVSPALVYERHAFFLCATALLLRGRGIPYVVEVNELVGDERVRRQPVLSALARATDRFVFRAATLIVVVSPHLQRRLEERGVSAAKIVIQPNAVEESQAELRDGTPVRDRFHLQGCCVLGFVGWFVEWHKLELLLAAVAVLAAQHDEVRLLLVGDGPRQPQLQALAAELGLAEKVIFAGPIAHDQIPAIIAAMDVAVIPHSNAYRSPIKLFEYLAQAKAVVAPATEPIAQVVRSSEEALLFEPESPSGLAEALRCLVENPALRVSLGLKGRETVLARHTWDRNAREILRRVFPERL